MDKSGAAAAADDVERGDYEQEHERRGTVWTATAHIVTAVIGSGVLALAWSVAQLGWVAGPLALAGFACVTYYTSTLLANAYRAPHPVTGDRNRTYMDAVRSYLSPREVLMCGIAQYVNLWGTMVGYTITATISMAAIRQSDCFRRNGAGARCDASGTVLMLAFSVVQVVLSQFPGLEHITWLSVVAAVMSFAYSFIGLGLSVGQWVSHGGGLGGRIAGATAASSTKKLWNVLLALGNIAFAYTFAEVLIEIQDTLKSPPPENKTMKKAAMYGIGATTIFYISVGCAGYAAFGSNAPGNILTAAGLGRFWLVDIANMCLILHLIGAYQMGRGNDERVGEWSGRQRRSQRSQGEREDDPPRRDAPKTRGNRNTSQPREDLADERISRRDVAKPRGDHKNQDQREEPPMRRDERKLRQSQDGEGSSRRDDTKPSANRDDQDNSRRSRSGARNTTDQYKIEFRKPQESNGRRRPQMVLDDSSSDSDSPQPDVPPKRKLRKDGASDPTDRPSEPLDKSLSAPVLSKRDRKAAGGGSSRGEEPPKEASPAKRTRKADDGVEGETAKGAERRTLTKSDPPQASADNTKPAQPSDAALKGKITPAPVTCLGNKEMNSDALTLAELCKDSDYGVPTEVVNGQSTAEVQPKDAALPPATAPVQSSTPAPSSDILSSDLPTDNGVPVLSGDTMRALLQDVVPAQSGCEPARPANDTATEVGKDLQDHIPLFKLRLIKKEDNAHLKLMSQLGVFQSQVELFRFAFPPNTSPDLDLPESLRDVYGDLKDIQDCLKSTPLDKARVARRIRQTLAFWGASYKEPLPSCLETVISRLQDLAGRLEGMQSSSSSEEKELTISEDGRDYLNKLDAAHSQATTKLEGYTKEQDEVQAQQTALTAEQQKADKEASELEEKARLARARARELLGETAELRKLSEACKRNIRVLEGRLEQIEEHQKIMKSHLVELQELAEEDPLAQHMAFLLAYSLPSNL